MAISYTTLINSKSAAGFGGGTFTTASFTPTANRQLLVVMSAEEDSGTTDPAAFFTISDSQGLTWTRVGYIGNAVTWSQGIVAWVSGPAAATSSTVSFNCGAGRLIDIYFHGVLEFDGGTGATAGLVVTSATTTDGAYTKTLGVAPTDADLSVFVRMLDSSTTTLSMGVGWTVVIDQSDPAGNGALAVAVRPTSTSTTVSVADTNVTGVPVGKASDMAFIVTAATARTTPVTRAPFTAVGQAGR